MKIGDKYIQYRNGGYNRKKIHICAILDDLDKKQVVYRWWNSKRWKYDVESLSILEWMLTVKDMMIKVKR